MPILSLDYLLFMAPALILAGLATLFTKATFGRYSHVRARSGLTGAQAAALLLESQGVADVRIEPVQGFLSDHYDPASRTLRLSPDVYRSPSLAAIGVACHEAGHALQHAARYAPLMLRSGMVPLVQFGSQAAYILFMLGFFLGAVGFIRIGIVLFTGAVAFSIVTLPVEWNASARAKRLMVAAGIVTPAEQVGAGRVLNAAFLTYVASAFTSLLTLVYYLARAGLLGRRDD